MKNRDRRPAYVVLRLAGQSYAVAASCVEQIAAMADVDCPPNAPRLLAGFLNLAGTSVPVIRLNRLFQQPETALELWTPLIVVNCGNQRLALLADRVERVLTVDDDSVLPLPGGHSLNDCIEGIIRRAGESVLVLSPERLLLQRERCTVEELRLLAEQRINELQGANA